jgi:hypothetical protein
VRIRHLIRAAVGDVATSAAGTGAIDLVGVEGAAALLGRPADWLYRPARKLPFTVQEGKGGRPRFSRSGIARYIREHQACRLDFQRRPHTIALEGALHDLVELRWGRREVRRKKVPVFLLAVRLPPGRRKGAG